MSPAEKLFRAIGGVPEELVLETMKAPKKGRKGLLLYRWGGLAAALVLVAGIGIYGWGRMGGAAGSGGAGHEDGSRFLSYAGPVFPLTVLEGGEGLAARRELIYDLSAFGAGSGLPSMGIADSARITNTSGEDRTVTAAYPFVGSFREFRLPTMAVDGSETAVGLSFGGYSGGYTPDGTNLLQLDGWEGYRDLLADGGYQRDALAGFRELKDMARPVSVYEFQNSTAPAVEEGAPTLAVRFAIDPERTEVYSYGFNGAEWDESGSRRYSYFVPKEGSRRDNRRFLIALGDPIGEYTLKGYTDGGCETELAGVTVQVTVNTMTLGEALALAVEDYCAMAYYDPESTPPLTAGMVYEAAAELLLSASPGGDDPKARYDAMMLDDVISEAVNMDRVFWITAEVFLPAGKERTVTVRYDQEPSYDFACTGSKNQGVFGYDMVSSLGSTLEFQELTAAVEHAEGAEIVRQNYGFDLEGGVTKVSLDPQIPRYYLEARRSSPPKA